MRHWRRYAPMMLPLVVITLLHVLLVHGQVAPVIDFVAVTYSGLPQVDKRFTCSTHFIPGGQPITTIRYKWFIAGDLVQDSSTPTNTNADRIFIAHDMGYRKGDAVSCTAQGFDSDGLSSNTMTSPSVVLVDLPPAVDSITVTPTSPRALDTVQCNINIHDYDDNGPFNFTVNWYKNGANVLTQTFPFVYVVVWTATLPSTITKVRGDVIYCDCTPADIEFYGTNVAATAVVVINTPPTLSSVSVFPSTQVRATTDLTCTLGTTTDPDGDTAFTYAFRWYRWQNLTFYNNGTLKNYTRVLIYDSTDPTTLVTTNILLHSYLAKGNIISCSATPADAYEVGVLVHSASVTVLNTAPVVHSVVILPELATAFYNLTCVPVLTTDVDPVDTVFNYTYRWYVNGYLITNASNHRERGVAWNGDGGSPWAFTLGVLPSYYLLKYDLVECQAAACDGYDWGPYSPIANATIANSPPILNEVYLVPNNMWDPAYILCVPGTFYDPDGDPISTTVYSFWVNGVLIQNATSNNNLTNLIWGSTVQCGAIVSDDRDHAPLVLSSILLLKAPVIASIEAHNPTGRDLVYVNGDYILITFNETTDRANLKTAQYSVPSACALAGTCGVDDATTVLGPSTILNRTMVDALFNFSHALGRDYRGQWINEQIFRLTVIDARGNGNPPIGVFRVTCRNTGGIRNAAQTSLYSYRGSQSPPLTGSWGTAPAGYLFGSTNKVVEVDLSAAALNVTLLPVPLQSIDFNDFPMTSLSSGADHAIAIANGVVYGVGSNSMGQLGLTTSSVSVVLSAYPTYSRYQLVPSIVALDSVNSLLLAAGGISAVGVAAGTGHSLVLGSNGIVYGSGLNFYGQLASTPPAGTPTTAYVSTFRALSLGFTVSAVGAGDDFSLFVNTAGAVYACGLHFGAIYTAKGYTSAPTLVTGWGSLIATEVSGGYDHALALVNGTVYAWGRNAEGQLGLGGSAADTVASPTLITSLASYTIVHISAGGFHSIAVDSKGSVFCWGSNVNGECGSLPSTKKITTPYEIAITSLGNSLASQVSAGTVTSLIATANGEVYAMGWNVEGVLGVAVSQTDVPLKATGGNDSFIALVGAGSSMSMAATRSSSSACPYDCFGHGGCYLGECVCSDLWIGDDCSIPRCPLFNGTECAGNGTCLVVNDLPTCFCNIGYGGETCTDPDCSISPYNNCTFNGNCTWYWDTVYPPYDPLNPNAPRPGVPTLEPMCLCDTGYGQPNCSYCAQGWSGSNCDILDCGFLNNCSYQGSCVATGSVVSCNCSAGWTGSDCSFPYCPGTPSCSGHGTCLYRETNITANITKGPYCQCDTYYSGSDCSNHTYTCLGTPSCSGHGNCTFLTGYAAPRCVCDQYWHTQTCSEPLCDSLNQCSGRGTCVVVNNAPACSCQDSWTGVTCSEEDSTRTTLIVLLVVGVVLVGIAVTGVICYGMYKKSKRGTIAAHRSNFFSSIQQRRQAFQAAGMK